MYFDWFGGSYSLMHSETKWLCKISSLGPISLAVAETLPLEHAFWTAETEIRVLSRTTLGLQ